MNYQLEKYKWTDADFDLMGWHDNSIYKIQLTEDLALDLDYILQWNSPELEGLPFTFWIAPATLVFRNVTDIRFDLEFGADVILEIEDIDKGGQGNGKLRLVRAIYNFGRMDLNNIFAKSLLFSSHNKFQLQNAVDTHLTGRRTRKI